MELAAIYNCGEEKSCYETASAQIPDRLDRSIDALEERGWFAMREEVVREAIRRFLEAHQPELREQFVREDVEWVLRGRS